MRTIYIFLILLIPTISLAQSHSKVKVWLDPISEDLLQQYGVEMDHGVVKSGVFLINDLDRATLEWMDENGIRYDVLIEDVKEYYRTRMGEETIARSGRDACFESTEDSVTVPEHFVTGSMGGFYTYEEFHEQLDSMHSLFPNLITERAPIDTFLTHEGLPIYYVKISDNVTVNEGEPQVLYTALHHAREPQSLTQLIFYMWYLLENYGSDDEVTALVDQTEMHFVPMLNPDGYLVNQTNDPNGGGLWRKNGRDNGDGTMGVDLNRNYGYEWAFDNSGSSPNTSSQTYRGPSAFSEPETRAIKWYCEQHAFGLAFNYHSYGNYIIYPWGFNDQLTPDSNNFRAITAEMTKYNDYVAGTGMETVGYPVNGDSDDWMYGEQTSKNKILSMTPEVGAQSDGFWPTGSRILPLSQENLHPNLILAHMVGDYAMITDASSGLLDSLTSTVKAEVTRLGLEFNGPYDFSIEPVSANIQSVSNAVSLTSMAQGEAEEVEWTLELDPTIVQGEEVVYDLVAAFNGKSSHERVTKTYGAPVILQTNSGEMDDFVAGSNWGATTEDYYSADHSITDSPLAPYQNDETNTLEYNRIIDLRQADDATLKFHAKWAIEAGWDYAQVLASPIGDDEWSPLCGKYSVEGNWYQDLGQPVWDGYQETWVLEEVDLSDYLGERIKIKFHIVSDNFVTFDGFYFDDMEVMALLEEGWTNFPDTGFVDTIGTTPPDTTTGIGDAPSAHRWTLYPNPASDHLHLGATGNNRLQAKVYSLTGTLMMDALVDERDLDVGSLPRGTYMIRLEDVSTGYTETHRVVLL